MQESMYALTMNLSEIDESEFSATEIKILEQLTEGRCTPAFIAEEIDVSQEYVRSRLSELKRLDLVEQVHRGLYELDQSSSGVTVKSIGPDDVDLNRLLAEVEAADSPPEAIRSFWWNQTVNVSVSGFEDGVITTQIEIIVTDDIDEVQIESIDDVDIDEFSSLIDSLTEVFVQKYDTEPQFEVEAKGLQPTANRAIIFCSDVEI